MKQELPTLAIPLVAGGTGMGGLSTSNESILTIDDCAACVWDFRSMGNEDDACPVPCNELDPFDPPNPLGTEAAPSLSPPCSSSPLDSTDFVLDGRVHPRLPKSDRCLLCPPDDDFFSLSRAWSPAGAGAGARPLMVGTCISELGCSVGDAYVLAGAAHRR